MSILVSPQELKESIYHGDRFTLLGTHWQPKTGQSFIDFASQHIPTALFGDTGAAFVGLPGSRNGRNPLPDEDKLQAWIRSWGLQEDRPVVVYDEGRGLFAGRAWWTLRWAGLTDVRILDGGLENWLAHGYQTLTGPGNIAVGSTFEVTPGQLPTATIDDVRKHDGVLIDTRSSNRFAGRRENLDLKAGHIPGAVNIPERLFHNDGVRTLKTPDEIREVLAAAGLTQENTKDAIIYSGSGNHSALALAAMEDAGFTGLRHYIGGWSQWSADPTNPVERGDRTSVND